MKAAKLFGPGDIRVVDCVLPEIEEDEILLKTSAAAICGSDLRMIANGYKNVNEQHPLTLGHEFSGIVEKVGARVEKYVPGMRVAVAPNFGCGICDHCVRGDTHLCAEYRAFGINIDGAFAEYIRVPASVIVQGNITILRDELPMDVAAVMEPAACVLNGQEIAGIHRGDTVLVVGAGPIGLIHALLALTVGAGHVLMSDLSKERLDLCVQVDSRILPIYEANVKDTAMKITGGKGLDVCITACPSPQAQENALEMMAVNGRVIYFGGLPAGKDCISINSNLIHYRQLRIVGSTRSNVSQFRSIAAMAESGRLNLAGLISRHFPLERFTEAAEYAGSARGLKTVISF